jgi:starch synthase
MDFVLSDSLEGGSFFDTNGGMDYHIDVAHSSVPAPPLNVFHIAVEMAPIAKASSLTTASHPRPPLPVLQ